MTPADAAALKLERRLVAAVRAQDRGACAHARLRALTPGGRCPLCEPRQDANLARLEAIVAPAREVIADLVLEAPADPVRSAREIEAMRREIAEAEYLLSIADGAACRRDIREFVRFGWHELDPSGMSYVPNAGTDALLLHLQAVADGQIKRLSIACAPGFGKTTAASIAFPAFMWARDPSWSAICASHAFELARDIAGKFHRVVTSDWYERVFPYVQVTGNALKAITTERGGVRYAVGVDGALTGLRARCGLVDDSLNAKDAGSKIAVRTVNDWFRQAFSTRFDRRASEPAIVVIQQRLAENDLIALMRELGAEVLELPALFEVGRRTVTCVAGKEFWRDPRTEEGEVLNPAVHTKAFLDEQKITLGPRGFAGQYQQRPAPREGNQFKVGMWGWFALEGDGAPKGRPEKARGGNALVIPRRENGSLDVDNVCVSVDATGGSTSDDASALGLGILAKKDLRTFLLEDRTEGPRGWLDTMRDVGRAIVRAAEIAGKQRRFTVLLEKKAMGASEDAPLPTQLREALATGKLEIRENGQLRETILLRYPDGSPIVAKLELYEPTGKGSKQQRADALEPDVDAGLVHLCDGAAWVDAFLEEFGLFGGGSGRDDRVDYVAQYVDHHRAPAARGRFKNMAR